MLHLEALACLAAFFLLLSFFFQAGQSIHASAEQGLGLYRDRLQAESQAFYLDSVYANTASQSLARRSSCRQENVFIVCRRARARLQNKAGILTKDARVRGNGHYQ